MVFGRGKEARLLADLAGASADDHVLDIGCGPGTAVRITAKRGCHVTGLDPSAPMLRLARVLTAVRRPKGTVEWVEAGAEATTLGDASVSTCWSLASVHHWPDLDGGVNEVKRVLQPGGVFIAMEKRSPEGATGNASHGWTDQQAESFADLLADAGFSSPTVTYHELGRRRVVAVAATV